MGANVTVISGATEIKMYFRNYTYATALSDLPQLSMVLFTDLDKIGYKNAASTLRKFLEDASGQTNTPEDRVFFADSAGRAANSEDLEFDGTDLLIDDNIVYHAGNFTSYEGHRLVNPDTKTTALEIDANDNVEFTHGWEFRFTDTQFGLYKDDVFMGIGAEV